MFWTNYIWGNSTTEMEKNVAYTCKLFFRENRGVFEKKSFQETHDCLGLLAVKGQIAWVKNLWNLPIAYYLITH